MTAIQLYKFIKENGLEHHNHGDTDVILFIPSYLMDEFCLLVKYTGEDIINVVMRDTYFAIELEQIVNYYGFDLTDFRESLP